MTRISSMTDSQIRELAVDTLKESLGVAGTFKF